MAPAKATKSSVVTNDDPHFKVELAPSNQAHCVGDYCKAQKKGVLIKKNELRQCTKKPYNGFLIYEYRHWHCVDPELIQKMKDVTVSNTPKALAGIRSVGDENVEIICKAFEAGHVDDKDWLGDVDLNRLGVRGTGKSEPKPPAVMFRDSENEQNKEELMDLDEDEE